MTLEQPLRHEGWACFMTNPNLLTPISHTKVGDNYTHTSLIDGFYNNDTTHLKFTCTTSTSSMHNSYHFPVLLHPPPGPSLHKPHAPATQLYPRRPSLCLKCQFNEIADIDTLNLTNILTSTKFLSPKLWQHGH